MSIVKNRITYCFPYYPKSQHHNNTPNNQFLNSKPSHRIHKRGEREVSMGKVKVMRSMRSFIPHNISMKDNP